MPPKPKSPLQKAFGSVKNFLGSKTESKEEDKCLRLSDEERAKVRGYRLTCARLKALQDLTNNLTSTTRFDKEPQILPKKLKNDIKDLGKALNKMQERVETSGDQQLRTYSRYAKELKLVPLADYLEGDSEHIVYAHDTPRNSIDQESKKDTSNRGDSNSERAKAQLTLWRILRSRLGQILELAQILLHETDRNDRELYTRGLISEKSKETLNQALKNIKQALIDVNLPQSLTREGLESVENAANAEVDSMKAADAHMRAACEHWIFDVNEHDNSSEM